MQQAACTPCSLARAPPAVHAAQPLQSGLLLQPGGLLRQVHRPEWLCLLRCPGLPQRLLRLLRWRLPLLLLPRLLLPLPLHAKEWLRCQQSWRCRRHRLCCLLCGLLCQLLHCLLCWLPCCMWHSSLLCALQEPAQKGVTRDLQSDHGTVAAQLCRYLA